MRSFNSKQFLHKKNLLTWWWFVGVSTALSLSFHPVFCCFTSQADYVELEQLKIQVSQGEGDRSVTAPTLAIQKIIESIAFVAPILGLYYILTIYCILTTMGLQVGFLGNTNFLDVKNVCCCFFFPLIPCQTVGGITSFQGTGREMDDSDHYPILYGGMSLNTKT